MDDFAVTFCITRHSLLESFVFYLLDDHTDEALKVDNHLPIFFEVLSCSIQLLEVYRRT